MITKNEIIPSLLKIFPNIQKDWEEYQTDWNNESPGDYTEISVFARRVITDYKLSNTEYFYKLFEYVEKIFNEGDEDARNLIGIGLLEDIQTLGSHEEFGYKVFEKWLRELSLRAWYQIEKMWEGKSSLMDVIRSGN
jgi:hypothetical protein